MDWTPFRRDPLAELAAECRRQGIRLCFYYSQLDWRCGDEPDRVIAIELRRPRR